MRAIRTGKYLISSAVVAGMLCAAPARADDTEKAGLIAALGLSAADGKSTLGDGAGKNEAALLTSVLIDRAGMAIAGVVNGAAPGPILVVSKDEAVSLFEPAVIKERIRRVGAALRICPGARVKNNNKSNLETFIKPMLADLPAAVATSTNYTGVETALDDRMLLNAVAMYVAPGAVGKPPRLAYPADIVGPPQSASILSDYQNMVDRANGARSCKDDASKAAVASVDAFSDMLTAPGEKGSPSLLMQAAQLEQYADPKAPAAILRVAIETQGGTAITRSGVWFTLGFPGAATIGAGLIASYRLSDSRTGVALSAGWVTCAIAPIKFSSVAKTVMRNGNGLAKCKPFGGAAQ